MVRLEEHKHETENSSIEKLATPARLYIPLAQHIGKPCSPLVKAGDMVFLGQKIASAQAHVFAPVHSSVSGKVASIQDWVHPVLGRGKTVVIDNDGLDKTNDERRMTKDEIDNLTAEQIRNIVFEAGIVGMGGATFPAHIKLNPPKPVDTLIINGAECEPYLTGDYRLMVEKTAQIIKGIELAVKCLGAKDVIVAIEDNKPEAIKTFNCQLPIANYQLRVLKSQYPQGGEKQLIKNILKKEVPSGKLPFDIGIVVHNVATVFAIYESVYLNKPLYERIVTVTGSCITKPKNLLVGIGTPIKELINYCGLKEEPAKVIVGGPMMGIAQYSLDVPVIKSSNGVLCLNKREVKAVEEGVCIRCGRCVEYCPAGLMPCLISMAAEKEKWDLAKAYGCLDCIECGLCAYVCPQSRYMVQALKMAKLKVGK
jgi:electron transport complex protein RnfC